MPEYISCNTACQILHCAARTLPTIAARNNVAIFKVPNHSRVLYSKADIERLAAEARQIAGDKGAGA